MNPEFLSGEASASPAVEPLLEGARRLAALGAASGALAARNGPRVTTHAAVPFEVLTHQDFVEVADYDPHLDRLMVLGSRAPHPHAGMLQLVFRAKKEVGALVLLENVQADAPEAKRGRTTLENALGILEALRGRDAVRWTQHLIVVGRTPEETLARAEALVGSAR
ncbi:MAG TPA: hypothetical protein VFH78_10475 [Candidatus Thermoplasmatota archaeon]|nr:hypothetical protein [Candidatus Thermoplasmatota archaeon]